jgi:hypothetical protein
MGGESARDPHVLDRGTAGHAAVVREPTGRRVQDVVPVARASIEGGDEQQPTAGGRGKPAGEPDDLRTEILDVDVDVDSMPTSASGTTVRTGRSGSGAVSMARTVWTSTDISEVAVDNLGA